MLKEQMWDAQGMNLGCLRSKHGMLEEQTWNFEEPTWGAQGMNMGSLRNELGMLED